MPKAIEQRLQDPAVRSHYLRAGIDIDALLAPYLPRPDPGASTPVRPAITT